MLANDAAFIIEKVKYAPTKVVLDVLTEIVQIIYSQSDLQPLFAKRLSEALKPLYAGAEPREKAVTCKEPISSVEGDVRIDQPASKAGKAKAKKAPPPTSKKKAQDVPALISNNRFSLFWPAAPDDPTDVKQAEVKLNPILESACGTLQVPVVDPTTSFDSSVQTVYRPFPDQSHERQLLQLIVSPSVAREWFEKQKTLRPVSHIVEMKARLESARKSVLPATLSQRLGIMAYSLRKSLGTASTVQDVKRAILNCQVAKDQITLLIDSVPSSDDPSTCRKWAEWSEARRSIAALLEKNPDTPLLEDEDLLYFITSVPNVHLRLQCMFITVAFQDVVGMVLPKLRALLRALDLAVYSKGLRLVWQSVRDLGNYLNEGTSRGGRSYFRLPALRRALDIRGNSGMTVAEYLAAFVGPVLTSDDWRSFCVAKDASAIQTYVAAKDVIETFLTIMNSSKDPSVQFGPAYFIEGERVEDGFAKEMEVFACKNVETARLLLHTTVAFVAKYASAAYYFGDPSTLLPIDHGIDADAEVEESPARDLFTRIFYFIHPIRAKVDSTRVSIPLPPLPVESVSCQPDSSSIEPDALAQFQGDLRSVDSTDSLVPTATGSRVADTSPGFWPDDLNESKSRPAIILPTASVPRRRRVDESRLASAAVLQSTPFARIPEVSIEQTRCDSRRMAARSKAGTMAEDDLAPYGGFADRVTGCRVALPEERMSDLEDVTIQQDQVESPKPGQRTEVVESPRAAYFTPAGDFGTRVFEETALPSAGELRSSRLPPKRSGRFRLGDDATLQRLRKNISTKSAVLKRTPEVSDLDKQNLARMGLLVPPARAPIKRRPRSSIEATFHLARHMER